MKLRSSDSGILRRDTPSELTTVDSLSSITGDITVISCLPCTLASEGLYPKAVVFIIYVLVHGAPYHRRGRGVYMQSSRVTAP